ncbi:MAG: sterol desaturase family protein [Bdellovibrionia bacterium]
MSKPYKSIRVFKSPVLEWFTHVHPLTPLIIWVPVISFLLWRCFETHQLSPYRVGIIGVTGFLFWTLVEYVLHRFLFHWEGQTALARRFHFILHGLHHDDPTDPTRLVMPPGASIPLGLLFYSLIQFSLGSAVGDAFFAFFIMGYLAYDYIHFSVHHFTPRTRIGKYLKQSHMIHHFISPETRLGVSSPIWDYVFGTLEEVKDPEQAA